MRLNKACKCRYSEEDILKCTNTRRRNGADVVNDTISPKGLAIRKGDRSGLPIPLHTILKCVERYECRAVSENHTYGSMREDRMKSPFFSIRQLL